MDIKISAGKRRGRQTKSPRLMTQARGGRLAPGRGSWGFPVEL